MNIYTNALMMNMIMMNYKNNEGTLLGRSFEVDFFKKYLILLN